jgi:hypothetical protein
VRMITLLDDISRESEDAEKKIGVRCSVFEAIGGVDFPDSGQFKSCFNCRRKRNKVLFPHKNPQEFRTIIY